MRHPFDGINLSSTEDVATSDTPSSRRSMLARILAATAGVVTAFLGRNASAQWQFDRRRRRVTTFALGEEGGRLPQPHPRATTYALGEEGGATTYAIGEEGGATTYALGEEGGVTTFVVGEEGGATTYALGEEGGVTTYATGEEGG